MLLTKLLAAKGAAASLAATCTRLRQLVHGNVKALNFRSLTSCQDLQVVARWTAGLETRFPCCERVTIRISSQGSYLVAQALMPALSR